MSRPAAADQRMAPGVAIESRLFWRALSSLVPVGVLLYMLWTGWPVTPWIKVALGAGSIAWIAVAAFSIRRVFVHQMRTLNTLIESICSEDYSLRGTIARETGDLSELFPQINSLIDELQQSRQDSTELRGLLERIITQFNVAVVAYDGNDRIVLCNHMMEKLLQVESSVMIGKPLKFYQLDRVLPAHDSHSLEYAFPGARGRWQVSRETYIHHGKQGNLLFIADLEQVLSDQEFKAWQRPIRTVANEVNNSLTPILSLCQTLGSILGRQVANGTVPHQDDLREGLDVINERARDLKNFISDYARIAQLPDARKQPFDLLALVARIVTIYREHHMELITAETAVPVFGDQAQIEQVLINVVKNAIEANADTSKLVVIKVNRDAATVRVEVIDEGTGIIDPGKLFVPFYTTKPQGAGIGLALARRIVAAHNGNLQLQNRGDGAGAVASLILPLRMPEQRQ